MFSHSDGIESFLKVVGYTGKSLGEIGYCATVVARLEKTPDGRAVLKDLCVSEKDGF